MIIIEVIYKNDNGFEVVLRQKRPLFLISIEGISAVKHIISTFKAPNQDGSVFVTGSLDSRHVVIEGRIIADSSEEAYVYRKQLLQVFNPKVKGKLTFRKLSVPCIVEEAPVFKADNQRLPVFLISLLCPSPYFETIKEIRTELALWHKLFSFELEIPDEDGIEFGRREENLIIPVENTGAVPCGATFEFRAAGVVEHPIIIDISTGKFIKLNYTMQAGEVITVSTHFANKKVISDINGNAFAYLDPDSDFIQLETGINLFRSDAAKNLDNLEVSVYFRPQFLGV